MGYFPSRTGPLLHVRDEKSSGTAGGASVVGWQTRTLNTIVTNEISGASLASNTITLPAGSYEIDATVPGMRTGGHRARLYNVTGSTTILLGTNEHSDSSAGTTRSLIRGRFTLTASTDVRVDHYCASAVATFGLGFATSQGTEHYTDALIRKVA